jgi:hypothetical protein
MGDGFWRVVMSPGVLPVVWMTLTVVWMMLPAVDDTPGG